MDDDFNTPVAIGELQRARAEINACLAKGLSAAKATHVLQHIRTFGRLLGLFQVGPRDWEFGVICNDSVQWNVSAAMIEVAISERQTARSHNDWKRSDEIRDDLKKKRVILEDRSDGTTRWKRE